MKRAFAVAALLLLVIPFTQPAFAQGKATYEIRGRVVDAQGKPVANVEVGTSWSFQGDSATPRWRSDTIARNNTRLRTDAEGKFFGTLYARRPSVAIFALDMKRKEGGVFIFTKQNPKKECTLKLEPLVHLHGRISIGDSNLKDSTYYIYVTDTRARIAIASSVSKETGFSFFMPPGEYQMSFSAKSLEKITMGVLLKSENRDLDLGSIELSPTNLARHYGKEPPPWNITEARGVKKDVTLADYKGKWVMIEFWAYW